MFKRKNRIDTLKEIAMNDKYELTPDEREFLFKECELAEKRYNKKQEQKPTRIQIANSNIKEKIYNILSETKGYTASEIAQRIDNNPCKTSALLKQMIENGQVKKYAEKGKSYFYKVEKSIIKDEPIISITEKNLTVEELLMEQNKLLKAILEKL